MQAVYSILGLIAALILVTAIANNLVSEAFAAKPGFSDNQGQCQKFFKGIAGKEEAHDQCHQAFHDDEDDNEE